MTKKNEDLMRYISGYESVETPQSIDEIKGDLQLAGLMTALNNIIAHKPTPLILDIGCGNGVLFAKLSETGCFKRDSDLTYKGFDFKERLPKAFENASKLNLLSKVSLFHLDSEWSTHMKEPCVVVVRNVVHELSLTEASDLIYRLCTHLPHGSTVFLQDMSTLPVAEKGRCGWMGTHVEAILKKCGLETILTSDTSKTGIDIYLIAGKKKEDCNKTARDIKDLLLSARKDQQKTLQLKYTQMQERPENTLPMLRLNHDITAISLQLGMPTSPRNNEEITRSTFALAFKALSITDFNTLRLNFKYPMVKWFQDRGHAIQAVDDFLLNDKSILLIIGPNFIGKKTAIWHALDKKHHSRLPIFIDLFTGVTIFNILESLAAQLGVARFLDVEILAALKTLPTEKLFSSVKDVVNSIAMNTILILDSAESVLGPESMINNRDVSDLIALWSSIDGAKIVIESRANVADIPSDKCQTEHVTFFKSREDSPRYGSHLYAVQLLQEIVPNEYRIPNSEHGGFPYDLLVDLDNHPYFLYVAGTAIRNNPDIKCLSNPTFVSGLKAKLADTLFSNFNLAEDEKELLYTLTLVKDGFPLNLLEIISDKASISTRLLGMGLILEISSGVFKALSVLRYINKTIRENYDKSEKKWHMRFQRAFQQLYRTTSNPIYYRQAHYHAVLGGESVAISAYNISEISKCADTWFGSRHYDDALWGFRKIRNFRQLTAKESMRLASCLMRTGSVASGRDAYRELMAKYRNWPGLRNSFIDSLIATGVCAKEALEQLELVSADIRDYYWYRQAARCYRQLNRRKDSYDQYEEAILVAKMHYARSIIKELIFYAKEVNDKEKIEQWLEYNSKYMKIPLD